MPTQLKRISFVITPEMEPLMDEAKKLFYNRTKSEMIRLLLMAGLNSLTDSKNAEMNPNLRRHYYV